MSLITPTMVKVPWEELEEEAFKDWKHLGADDDTARFRAKEAIYQVWCEEEGITPPPVVGTKELHERLKKAKEV